MFSGVIVKLRQHTGLNSTVQKLLNFELRLRLPTVGKHRRPGAHEKVIQYRIY